MIYNKLKIEFNNSTDLKHKIIKNIEVVYLESLCSSDKINEYILKNLTLGKKSLFLKDKISGPSVIYVHNYSLIKNYLLNGYALIYDGKDYIVCEVKAELFRAISFPTNESSVNGPKDSFNENIVTNLGLIKRRIKSEKLVNYDLEIGAKTKTKISLLYLKDIAKKELINQIISELNKINIDCLIDVESLPSLLQGNKNPLPTIMRSERPDVACNALLQGKAILVCDNSPYILIIPSFFIDFINPIGDKYVTAIHVNFLKILRFICLFITVFLPAIYISLVCYNPEVIPLNLILSFQSGRAGVPFPSYFEALLMLILCAILRESDIRFPSNYGSSISVIGALIIGTSAVSANIASPIMIIIVGITFVSGLIFSHGEIIDGLRIFRFLALFLSIILGFYGLILSITIFFIHLCSTKTFNLPYFFPISPLDKTYLFQSFLKKNKTTKRSRILSNNIRKAKQ